MMNPLLWLGCAGNGEHVWSKTYQTWKGHEERECRWCGRKEKRSSRG